VSRSFRESVGSSPEDLAIKVFCAWDFKVTQRRSVKLRCENICTQLKELLMEQRSLSRSRSCCQWLCHCMVTLLAWVLALGSVLGCALAVHYISQHMHVVSAGSPALGLEGQEAILLVLPLVVSLLNALMPHLYNLLATWEKQDSPVTRVYVAVCRWAAWGCGEGCWETCVGQELYRFMVMDFIFTLLDTLFGELICR
uniref:Transmembrane channel-like protein n=1 Tax=Malurus cyaneus samueli TaxID=2593467 RepID=A0A8C5X950_9PASS